MRSRGRYEQPHRNRDGNSGPHGRRIRRPVQRRRGMLLRDRRLGAVRRDWVRVHGRIQNGGLPG